ncbi:MAG TPA: amidohydrolase family protein, partial [Gammaproteobacteria bacterium]|nr:amidohydrolase family protein [Gammaproteobacteria bacterium]
LHCHVFVPEAAALVGAAFDMEMDDLFRFANQATREVNAKQAVTINEQLVSVERRIADMDAMNVDVQAISPAPLQYYYCLEPELGRDAARMINDRIAAIAAEHPERIVGLANVPMQSPEFAVAELERAVRDLGLRGVEISTNVAGKELSEQRFRKFFARAEELGIVVFLHPSGFSDGRRLMDHYFTNVIGNPLDSTIAVSHLIFGGVLDAYPKLKVVVAHGGGYLAAYSGRIDHAHGARPDCRRCIQEPPTTYLKRLYFDTVVFTEHQLEYLARLYGSDHIVLGTDYPYDMGMYDPVGFVEAAAELTDADKDAIVGGNAARLLGIAAREKA